MAARKLGFLPKGNNMGINHVEESANTWLMGFQRKGFQLLLATIESLLGPNSVSASQMEHNQKYLQSSFKPQTYVKDVKDAISKIIQEMQGDVGETVPGVATI